MCHSCWSISSHPIPPHPSHTTKIPYQYFHLAWRRVGGTLTWGYTRPKYSEMITFECHSLSGFYSLDRWFLWPSLPHEVARQCARRDEHCYSVSLLFASSPSPLELVSTSGLQLYIVPLIKLPLHHYCTPNAMRTKPKLLKQFCI